MNSNLVPLDRAIRGGAGLFLVATPILDLHTYPLNLLGLIPLATAIVGYCPLYALVSRLFRAPSGGRSRTQTA